MEQDATDEKSRAVRLFFAHSYRPQKKNSLGIYKTMWPLD
jgi:hypothetical protein